MTFLIAIKCAQLSWLKGERANDISWKIKVSVAKELSNKICFVPSRKLSMYVSLDFFWVKVGHLLTFFDCNFHERNYFWSKKKKKIFLHRSTTQLIFDFSREVVSWLFSINQKILSLWECRHSSYRIFLLKSIFTQQRNSRFVSTKCLVCSMSFFVFAIR